MNATDSSIRKISPLALPPDSSGFVIDDYALDLKLLDPTFSLNIPSPKRKPKFRNHMQRYRAFRNHSSANDQPHNFASW